MPKKIVLVTEAHSTMEVYKKWLGEFFGEWIRLECFSVEEGNFDRMSLDADLYLVTATSTNAYSQVVSIIPQGRQVVAAAVTFRRKTVEMLRAIPRGTRALMVNQSVQMAIESIAELNRLGVTQVEFIPAYPGFACPPDVRVAITPGEARYVPRGMERVIDLGDRVFTADTLIAIALKLGFTWFPGSPVYRNHVETLADQGHSLAALWNDSLRAENYLDILMGALAIGIIGVDVEDRVFAVNWVAEEMLHLSRGSAIGSPLSAVSRELFGHLEGENRRQKISRLIKLEDTYINLSTAPADWLGEPVGCFIMLQRFTEEENRQNQFRLQLYDRGYKSKYTFADIEARCPAMVHAKDVACKMARTDSSILLTGESGTGKELFAHSIHHASRRREMPFVAINCAALSESLLESELFGYSEGAFTGAKKGGRPGLFEYAHRGTLFLDEIEGMSPNLQVKLLRVLQEKEVMRVGGDRIITIDVRIVAATNEDILERVRAGTFRKDLYYRLNTLPIQIPPLRERGDDIFLIMESMMRKRGISFTLSPQARAVFRGYSWDGNVRELANLVEYLAFTGKETVEVWDLPAHMTAGREERRETPSGDAPSSPREAYLRAARGREEPFSVVLDLLAQSPGGMGRGTICSRAGEQGVRITDQEARGILETLSRLGLVTVSRGRGGSRLTREGLEIWRGTHE